MQQIYRKTPIPKCEITLRHGCSPVNLLHIFTTPFTKNISRWLLQLVPSLKTTLTWWWSFFNVFISEGVNENILTEWRNCNRQNQRFFSPVNSTPQSKNITQKLSWLPWHYLHLFGTVTSLKEWFYQAASFRYFNVPDLIPGNICSGMKSMVKWTKHIQIHTYKHIYYQHKNNPHLLCFWFAKAKHFTKQ